MLPSLLLPIIQFLGIAAVVLLLFSPVWGVQWPLSRSQRKFNRGDHAGARAVLERALRSPFGVGVENRATLRYQLAWYYMADSRYAEAADQVRAALAAPLPWQLEATLRKRLAECLEALEQGEPAFNEWQRALALTDGAVRDASWYLFRGKLLAAQHQHAAACHALEQALKLATPAQTALRHEALAQLAISSYNAGRPDQTIQWANQGISEGLQGVYLKTVHGMAGVGYSVLGKLTDSARHRRAAYELAQQEGSTSLAAKYLAQLANVYLKQGLLGDATAEADRAISIHPDARRTAWCVQSDTFKARGLWNEARELLENARETPAFPQPAEERRAQATFSLARAWLEFEAGDAETAWRHLEQAGKELVNDERLSLWCEITSIPVLAAIGRAPGARAAHERAEAALSAYPHDVETRSLFFASEGRYYFLLGEHERAAASWRRFLELDAGALQNPTAYYFIGECCVALGDLDAARAAYGEALEVGIPTYHARLAADRLLAMDDDTV